MRPGPPENAKQRREAETIAELRAEVAGLQRELRELRSWARTESQRADNAEAKVRETP